MKKNILCLLNPIQCIVFYILCAIFLMPVFLHTLIIWWTICLVMRMRNKYVTHEKTYKVHCNGWYNTICSNNQSQPVLKFY